MAISHRLEQLQCLGVLAEIGAPLLPAGAAIGPRACSTHQSPNRVWLSRNTQ
jgi:hypothetical protein